MIVAITGGGGFIGRNLVEYYTQQGDTVRLLSRSTSNVERANVQYFLGDLSSTNVDLSSFLDNVDILYHCAGEIRDESLMQELHVNGTQRLVRAAKGKVGRWVQLSSVGAYGPCRDQTITEDSEERPSGIYEETKAKSDDIVKNSGLSYVILRPSNVFGEGMVNQSLRGLLSVVNKGLFFFIGKKNTYLVNYVHVEDVVRALTICGSDERALGEVFNLSQSTTVENMIASFVFKARSNKKILRVPESVVRVVVHLFWRTPGFILTPSRVDALTNKCIYSSVKIQRMLGFVFSAELEERLKLFAEQK